MIHFALLALFHASPAMANYLTYIDDKGTKHVVQSADDIPEQYRNSVKQSAAGNARDSFFAPNIPYLPDPKLSPKANCEKEASYNFETVKKKLFARQEGALSPDEMKIFGELESRRESARAKCAKASDKIEEPKKETAAANAPAANTPPAQKK